MEERRSAIQFKEGQEFFFDGAYRTIFFNIIIAIFLAIYLTFNQCPAKFLIIWLGMVSVVNCIRLIHCKLVLGKYLSNISVNLHFFAFLTMLAGLVWASIYFVAIRYTEQPPQYVIILVFGGMVVGAVASLAVYLPAFMAYALAIFIPVIVYNYYIFDLNHVIMGTMFLMFLIMIAISAKEHKKVLDKVFFLTEQNKILSDKFEMLSITDALTSLYNRRYFNNIIEQEYNRAKRNGQSLALVSIDIDNFKLINDNFGHPFGDKFLLYTADYLKTYLKRANDIIFRLGGDEFAALLINLTEENVRNICEEIKANFMKSPEFEYDPKDSKHQQILKQVSFSVGVAYATYDSTAKIEQIIDKADELLYQVKKEGKNNIKYSNDI